MKKVETIVRPEKVNGVKDALAKAGYRGLTAVNVKGRGRQMGLEFDLRGRKFRVDLIPKCKLELVVREEDVDRVIKVTLKSAKTGEMGDGMIFVTNVERVVGIRTGEEGLDAVS
ncbi:MAG: P-II family nitrogen regulator [Thermoprotei archaeon]|nr:MAG: P-II family nitrogen regulator [Thermoprotei archaeon]